MSWLVQDDALLDDMAQAILALRRWLFEIGEHHPDLSAAPLDDLIRRYHDESERRDLGV